MKKLLFTSILFLVSCSTAEKPTGAQMCSNLCSEVQQSPVNLYEDSTCICKTDNGIKNTMAVCLVGASNPVEADDCVLQALASCTEDASKKARPAEGSFCERVEQALSGFKG